MTSPYLKAREMLNDWYAKPEEERTLGQLSDAIVTATLEAAKEKTEEVFGKKGTMSGSLGYQGIVAGIHAFQTHEDQLRDQLLTALEEMIKNKP
jgi:hypothetical protein